MKLTIQKLYLILIILISIILILYYECNEQIGTSQLFRKSKVKKHNFYRKSSECMSAC